MRSWRDEGVDIVLCALTSDEISELELQEEARVCAAAGIEYLNFPIADRGVPASVAPLVELVRDLEGKLAEGRNVAIHCRQGVGRSAILAACLLTSAGMDVEAAFGRIEAARGCKVPDTEEQKQWVARFARTHLPASTKK